VIRELVPRWLDVKESEIELTELRGGVTNKSKAFLLDLVFLCCFVCCVVLRANCSFACVLRASRSAQ